MSKDWTPKELYTVEQYNLRTGGGSVWQVMENATFIEPDGTETKLYSEDEIAVRRRFPTLGLLYGKFATLYAYCAERDELDFLSILDGELEQYIAAGKGDRQSPLILWYEGKLDKNFYYRERNDELFLEWIKREIETVAL